jgi:DNA-binding winged helix-turn-helix (wHTH) protein
MDALREQIPRPLTAADLAGMPDFRLGAATVSPSRRTLVGPGGESDIQPRVMQVLAVLAEQAGQVVARETLFERCWGGVYVGDDSLNRAVAALRKLASEIAAGTFEIETIPKAGYRLTGTVSELPAAARDGVARRLTRRQLGTGIVAVAALGGIGAWAAIGSREERRFEQLLRDGDAALAGDDSQFRPDVALRSFQAAVRIHPDSARALGRLAHAQSYFALWGPPADAGVAFATAMQTAQKALAIDPRDVNALMAMFELQGSTLDWWSRDQSLRHIIGIDPTFGPAIAELTSLLGSAGLCRESWNWNERLLRLAPMSENCLGSRALKLWIFGRVADANNTIGQLRAQFPTSAWIRGVQFVFYAFTGRAAASQGMLDAEPRMFSAPGEAAMWRASLPALIEPSAANIVNARKACLGAASVSGNVAAKAVAVLCALGDVDSAFDIANGSLLSRGTVVPHAKRATGSEPTDAIVRIKTDWLFIPPCRNMRADKRFLPLCDGVGLVEYWKRRGVQPDYMRLDRAVTPSA